MATEMITIDGGNQWTDRVHLGLSGVTLMVGDDTDFNGIITVQFVTNDFSTWISDVQFREPCVHKVKGLDEEIFIRIGCASTDYVSGSIKCAIYRGAVEV